MIIYGRNPVREALCGRRGGTVRDIWVSPGAAREPWLVDRRVRVTDVAHIEERCGTSAHQGVCADAGPFPYVGAQELLGLPEPTLLVLDQIQDPQNLGALCRSAECAGVAGVAIPERRAAEISPAVCKASAGAVEHLRVARVRNIADFLADAKAAGCWCYGASSQARVGYDGPDYRGAVVLVLGGEGSGLRPRVAGACDELISLPLRGRTQSLNVSAAGAVIMYEILQRKSTLDSAP